MSKTCSAMARMTLLLVLAVMLQLPETQGIQCCIGTTLSEGTSDVPYSCNVNCGNATCVKIVRPVLESNVALEVRTCGSCRAGISVHCCHSTNCNGAVPVRSQKILAFVCAFLVMFYRLA